MRAVVGCAAIMLCVVPTAVAQASGWTVTATVPQTKLDAVVATSPSAAWAFGSQRTGVGSEAPAILEWDGTAWSVASAPLPTTGALSAAGASSATNVWAVGSYATPGLFAEHWDGTAWSTTTLPTSTQGHLQILRGVAVVSDTAALAVGESVRNTGAQHSLAELWNGTDWQVIHSPNPSNRLTTSSPRNDLSAVSGTSADDIWTVGTAVVGRKLVPAMEHWNGAKWDRVYTPLKQNRFLAGVDALSPTNVWAVGGRYSATSPLIMHWNGTRWSVKQTPTITGCIGDLQLNSITGSSRADLWAIGVCNSDNAASNQQTLTLHFDGTGWTQVPSPDPNPSGLNAFWAAATVPGGGGQTWAVGTTTPVEGTPPDGIIAQYTP